MTKREEKENALILSLGCWVCRKQGIYTPGLIHHVRRLATSKKRKKAPKLALCQAHHDAGIYGTSIHAGREAWEANFGDEVGMSKEAYRHFGITWDF